VLSNSATQLSASSAGATRRNSTASRHFLVTQLIAAGVDVRTVSGRVGHRDGGRTTLGTYANFQAAQDRTAAELMEGLIRLPQVTNDG
jgi:site-specific recombinase XerD